MKELKAMIFIVGGIALFAFGCMRIREANFTIATLDFALAGVWVWEGVRRFKGAA